MNVWVWAALVLAVVGLVPGVIRAATGTSLQRLVGLQLVSAVVTMISIALSMAVQQGSYLIVPLVLVLLSAAGTLVFTRLLRSDHGDQEADERVEESSG
jgi:multicomponent Na+:H+ antiporter subunit F